MKILNINSYYYSSSVHKQLQNAIYNKKISVLTYAPLPVGYIPREECRYENETHVIRSECYNKKDRYIFYIKHNKILKDIRKRINIKNFDCIHAHSLFSNGYIALKLKEEFKIPYVVAVRDTDLNIFFKYMLHLRYLGIKILCQADVVVFLSQPYKDHLIDRYIPQKLKKEIFNKSVIIPNGVNEFWLKNKGYPKKIQSSNTLKLLYVGVISKRKNLITTVKAIQILRNKGYNIILTVVGKILDRSIFDKIKDLSYINYIQPVSKEELIKIYRDNDIFVMPSIHETFGLVYAEAMSQGLPVIYSKGQGFDGQFEEGKVGYHVDSLNPHDIANKIIDITKNYEKLSQNCVKLCKKFDWNLINDIYNNIYNSIIV